MKTSYFTALAAVALSRLSALVSAPPKTRPDAINIPDALMARPRAVSGVVRADVSDPKEMVKQLNAAFNEFKAANEQSLKSKVDDTVLNEKLAKIEATMADLDTALADNARKIAAAALGTPGDLEPTNPEYVTAFKSHMRRGDVAAAMTEGTAAEGGYLAPVEWDRTITNKLKLRSPIRENAQTITISGPGFSRVYNDGVVGSGWVGETAARPATSTPGLTSIGFAIGEIYANPAITQTLLDDAAVNLEEWLAGQVEGEFAVQENIAFLSGNGVNKPQGILNYVTGGTAATSHPLGAILAKTAASATVVTTDEIIDLVYDLPAEREGNAKFYLNRANLAKIRKLKDGQGNYIWQPTYVAAEPSTLLGSPVVQVPGMPAMTAGLIPVLYGDMAMTYLVIDRVGIRVLRDPFTNKPYVHFYTTKRVGGGVQNPEYMRALKMAAS